MSRASLIDLKKFMTILETDRLCLRDFIPSDVHSLQRVFRNPEVMHFGPGVQSIEWIEKWIHEAINCYELRGYGPWAIMNKADNMLMGYCGLFYFPDVCGQPETEIGIRLSREYWGLGFATEAVTAVRDFAFHSLGLGRLIAMVDPLNVNSLRVVDKAGMVCENTVMFEGYSHPDYVYSVVSTEPSGSGRADGFCHIEQC